MVFELWHGRLTARKFKRNRQLEKLWRLPHRFDAVLAAILFAGLGAVAIAGGGIGYLQKAYGIFDPPPFEKVTDDRMLDNIRSSEARKAGPFVAAVQTPAEDAFYALRVRGLIHRFDLATGLWSDTDALARQDEVGAPYVDLSLACPRLGAEAIAGCEDRDAVFAYSAKGGLLLRRDGQWQTVVSDSRFVGLSGALVSGSEVVSAAVSDDGAWLLLATRSNGLGLFDLSRRHWIALAPATHAAIFGPPGVGEPTALAAFHNDFLIGTGRGLVRLEVTARSGEVTVSRSPVVTGKVIDIAVGAGEALVLADAACPGGSCLALDTIGADDRSERLMGETQTFPLLSETNVSRALVSDDRRQVFVLGAAGVYAYDRTRRSWTQLSSEPTTAILEAPSIDGIYFAQPGRLSFLSRKGSLRSVEIEGARIVSLSQSRHDGTILAQTETNATYSVGQTAVLLTSGHPADEPLSELKRSVHAFGNVVALGSKSILIHDPATRAYHSILRASMVNSSLFEPAARLIGTDRYLWCIHAGKAAVFTLDRQTDTFHLVQIGEVDVPRSIASLSADGDAVLGTDGGGIPFRLSSDGSAVNSQTLIGAPLPTGGPVVDALHSDNAVYLARRDRIDIYSEATRGLASSISMPIDEGIKAIARLGNATYMLGERGSIVREGNKTPISGSRNDLPFGSEEISDAILSGDQLFLAAPGAVSSYSLSERREIARYPTPSTGVPKLAGIIDGTPVSYDGRGAWFGTHSLAVNGARVVTANVSGSAIATTQVDGESTVFLARHDTGDSSVGSPVCFFNAPGPAQAVILDAVSLPGGPTAILTPQAVWIRDDMHQRLVAFRIASGDQVPGTHLIVLGSYLVAASETDAVAIPLAVLRFPDSCADQTVDLRQSVVELSGMRLSVSAANNAVFILNDNGSLEAWREGKRTTLLAAATKPAPNPVSFQAADQLGSSLLFADAGHVWTYDGRTRTWQMAPIAVSGGSASRLDVWNNGNGIILTASDAAGKAWGGVLPSGTAPVKLDPLRQRNFPLLPFPAADLIDVGQLPDGGWVFLGRGHLAIADWVSKKEAVFSAVFVFGSSRSDRRLEQANGRILVVDGDPNSPDQVHLALFDRKAPASANIQPAEAGFLSFSPRPDERFAVTNAGDIIRVFADGRVLLCPADYGPVGEARCKSIATPALVIDPGKIAQSFDLGGNQFLIRMSTGDLVVLDRRARQMIEVGRGFPPIEAVFGDDDAIAVLDNAKRLSLLAPDRGPFLPVAEGVRAVRRVAGVAVVETDHGAIGIQGSKVLNAVDVFTAVAGAAPTGKLQHLDLDAEGLAAVVATPEGRDLVDLRAVGAPSVDHLMQLPGGAALASDVRQSTRLAGERWLLRLPGRLLGVRRGACWQESDTDQSIVLDLPTDDQATDQPSTDLGSTSTTTSADQTAEPPLPLPKPVRVACLEVTDVFELPASAGSEPVITPEIGNDQFVIAGRKMNVDDCSLGRFDYDDGPYRLSGRPETRSCRLVDAGAAPEALIEVGLRSAARDFLLSRIDPRTHRLDETRIEPVSGEIEVSIGDIRLQRWPGSPARDSVQPLDEGWISWQRESRRFAFSDPNGRAVSLSASEAMPGGQFVFAAPGTAVMTGVQEYAIVNSLGVWGYSLMDPGSLVWTRASVPDQAIGVGRGRVFFADGRSIGSGEATLSSAPTRHVIKLGNLTVAADIGRTPAVRSMWTNGVEAFDGFYSEGFIFDFRQDVAVEHDHTWLQTPVGLVDVADLGQAAPLAFSGDGEPQLIGWKDAIYARSAGGRWARLDHASWQATVDPGLNRVAATDGRLKWQFVDGRLDVSSQSGDPSEAARTGLRFERDVIATAALGAGGLVYVQADGTRQVSSLNDIALRSKPAVSFPIDADHLDIRPLAGGQPAVVAVSGNGHISAVWTGSGYRRLDADENPDVARTAAAGTWLRVRFEATRPVVEIAFQEASGSARWSAVGWRHGSPMPFDVFTALHAQGGMLVAGSPVGLQLLGLREATIASQVFLDTRRAPSAAYDTVQRIGTPWTSQGPSDHLVVTGAKTCAALRGTALSACASPDDSLTYEILGGNGFWLWFRSGEGVRYIYVDLDGHSLGKLRAVPDGGRFQHDVADDIVACGGDLMQAWSGVTTRLQASQGVKAAANLAVEPGAKLAFYCHHAATALSADDPKGLPTGLYAFGQQTWFWSGGRAIAQPEFDRSVRSRAGGFVAFEAKRLRVVNTRAGVEFQYRRGTNWEALEADGQRLAVDQRDALVFAGHNVWASSPAGLLPIDDRTGNVDPDAVVLVRADSERVKTCDVDAIETADGRSSFMAVPPEGEQTFVRCADGRVLSGRLDASTDETSLKPIDGVVDPFENRGIFDDDVVAIRLIGRTTGRDGSLVFTWRGEANPLAAGRFALDQLRSLARVESDKIDVVSDLGWVRQSRLDLTAAGAQRPANVATFARQVVNLSVDSDIDRLSDLDRPTAVSLCVEPKSGSSGRWYPTGRFEAGAGCGALLGYDGLYAYRRIGDGVRMTGRGRNNAVATRQLADGRFSDHAVLGHAVLTVVDDRSVIAAATDGQIVVFDAELGRQSPGWVWNDKLSALSITADGAPAALSSGRFQTADGREVSICRSFSDFSEKLYTNNITVRGITFDQDRIYFRLFYNGGQFEVAMQCSGFPLGLIARAAVGDRTRYSANRARWDGPAAMLDLTMSPSKSLRTVVARMGDRSAALPQSIGEPSFFRLVGDRFLVATDDDIFQSNVDALMDFVQRNTVP